MQQRLLIGDGKIRRFPPMVQFLTRSSPHVEREIRANALEIFRRGGRLEQVCAAVYRTAKENRFNATIGVQEISSASMPSFAGETVLAALLIVDLQYDPELPLPASPEAGS